MISGSNTRCTFQSIQIPQVIWDKITGSQYQKKTHWWLLVSIFFSCYSSLKSRFKTQSFLPRIKIIYIIFTFDFINAILMCSCFILNDFIYFMPLSSTLNNKCIFNGPLMSHFYCISTPLQSTFNCPVPQWCFINKVIPPFTLVYIR